MTEIDQQSIPQPTNYLNNLLQKNPKASSKAQQYVALKNVQISQKLINGEQLIANQQAQIKALKNQSNYTQKDGLQKKILIIQNEKQKNLADSNINSQPKQISDQQRLKFVKQKLKQNKLIAKRKQQQLKKLQQRQKLQKQKSQQQQVKKMQQIKQKRIQQTRKKLQQIQKRKQQRVLQNKKTNELLKQKSKQKILAQKIHQRFLSNQNLMLDQKKKKLAELRQLYKPIDKKQLDQHMKKFQQSRLQRSRNKSSNKNVNNTEAQKKNQYYRSMFHQILQKQKKQKQQESVDHQYKIKQLKQKGKKYAQEIKVNFKPQIDPKKRDQIEKRIKSSSLIGSRDFDNKMKGMQYLQFAKQYGQKFKKQIEQPQNDKLLMKQQANKTHQADYLAQFRKVNESRLKRSATSAQDFIKKVERKNLSHKQKQQQIIQYAEDLQRKARQKQRISKIGSHDSVDEQVDKLYISAIQAKIKALQV